MSLPLLLPLLLGAAGNVKVEGGGSLAAVVRTVHDLDHPEFVAATSIESALLPHLSLSQGLRTRVQLTYAPRFIFPGYLAGGPGDVGSPIDRLSHSHHVELTASTEQGRLHYDASAGLDGGMLDQTTTTVSQTPSADGGQGGTSTGQGTLPGGASGGQGSAQQGGAALPPGTHRKVPYLTTLGSLGMGGRIGRSLDLGGAISFSYGGGTEEATRGSMPIQGGLLLQISASYAANLRDQITGFFAASTTRTFTLGYQAERTAPAYLLRVGGGFSHVFGGGFSAGASGGAAGFYAEILHTAPTTGSGKEELLPAELHAMPWAQAGMRYVPPRGQAPTLGLQVGVEPNVDRLNGNVNVGANVALSSAWSLTRILSVDAGLGYGRNEPFINIATIGRTQQSATGYSAGLGLRLLLGRDVSTGVRGIFSYQDSERADVTSLREMAGLIDLSFTPTLQR